MNVYEKLLSVQTELKAPKSQYNSFGKYNYRNCEDILEAVKPILARCKAALFLSDEVVEIGQRIYVKATATLVNVEQPDEKIAVTAYAREEESKKGMDGSQVTGASSSYARKYALNGLFDVDDTKDSDTTNNSGNNPQQSGKPSQKPQQQKSTKKDSQPQKPKSSKLSKESADAINRAIKEYSTQHEMKIAEVVKVIERELGKPMGDCEEIDVDVVMQIIDNLDSYVVLF